MDPKIDDIKTIVKLQQNKNTLLQGLEEQFEITHSNLDYFLSMEITKFSICVHSDVFIIAF